MHSSFYRYEVTNWSTQALLPIEGLIFRIIIKFYRSQAYPKIQIETLLRYKVANTNMATVRNYDISIRSVEHSAAHTN
jgi:hypothetical protein